MKLINYIFPILIIALSLSEFKLVGFHINQPIGWILLMIASFILFTLLKNKLIIATLILFMLLFRMLALINPEFYTAYEITNGLIFFICGLLAFSYQEKIFHKQILFIVCICAPIMFLQLAGVPWVFYHTYGQYYALTDQFINTIFQPAPLLNLSHYQFRPPAILWSNQPMGLLITFSFAYLLFHPKPLKWFHYFSILLVVVFSTSYYVYISSIILLILIFIINKKYLKKRKLKILTGSICAFTLLVIVFPGIYAKLFQQFDFLSKIYVRILDYTAAGIDTSKIPFVSELRSYLFSNAQDTRLISHYNKMVFSTTYTSYSIIGMIYENILFGIVVITTFIIIWIRLITVKISTDPLKLSKLVTLFVIICFLIVNPRGVASILAFFLAFPFTSMFPNFINKYSNIKLVH